MNRNRGVTLMEVLIFSAVIAVVSAMTMRAVGQGRVMRGNARDRITMAALAQGELDRARLTPPGPGVTQRTDPAWPVGVVAETTVMEGPEGTTAIDVRVWWKSAEGKPSVRLSTLAAPGQAADAATTSPAGGLP